MRVEFDIGLNSIEKVKTFAYVAMGAIHSEIYVISGKHKQYICDGKSILGLFSLNLLSPMRCVITGNSETEIDSFYNNLNMYGIVLQNNRVLQN